MKKDTQPDASKHQPDPEASVPPMQAPEADQFPPADISAGGSQTVECTAEPETESTVFLMAADAASTECAPAAPEPAGTPPPPAIVAAPTAPPAKPAAPISNPEPVPALAPAATIARNFKSPWILSSALFCVLAAGVGFGVFLPQAHKLKTLTAELAKQTEQMRTVQNELEAARMEVSHLQLGSKTLTGLLDSMQNDWNRPPGKPSFLKVGKGVVIFWDDGLIWRRYYLYQKKEGRGVRNRYNTRPMKKSFVYLANPAAGTWQYTVTALNKEGKETAPGDTLTVQLPLP